MKSAQITIATLAILSLTTFGQLANAQTESQLPPGAPGTFRLLARHLDSAKAMSVQNFMNCSDAFSEISADLASIAIGQVQEANIAAVSDFKAVSFSVARAHGACLAQDQLSDARVYSSKMLDQAAKDLIQLAQSIGY